MDVNSIQDIIETFSGNNLTILQNLGLIRRRTRCKRTACRRYCSLIRKNNHYLGHIFRCNRCRSYRSVTEGTFFQFCHIPVISVFMLLWLWCCRTRAKVASAIVNIPKNTVLQQNRYIRDICSWKLLQIPDQFEFGGPGCVVQIDESVITKCKYNVGRVVREQWVFGIFGINENRGIIMYIDNRSAAILIKKIKKHIKPGTEIWSDSWKGYSSLSNLVGVSPYIHKTVNHSRNFVDPVTGICTNHVEAFWAKLKGYLRKLGVMSSHLLPEHIDEFMWMELYGQTAKDAYTNMLVHISERYRK